MLQRVDKPFIMRKYSHFFAEPYCAGQTPAPLCLPSGDRRQGTSLEQSSLSYDLFFIKK